MKVGDTVVKRNGERRKGQRMMKFVELVVGKEINME